MSRAHDASAQQAAGQALKQAQIVLASAEFHYLKAYGWEDVSGTGLLWRKTQGGPPVCHVLVDQRHAVFAQQMAVNDL